MGLLNPNDVLYTNLSNQECVIDRLLGGGGQGEVYRAFVGGRAVAVKWYFNSWLQTDTQLESRLTRAIEKGPPSDRFLWPEQLVYKNDGQSQGFGYIMPLREDRFKGLVDMVSGRTNPKTGAISMIGFELAHGFLQLHAEGMCYQDISFGNVFFDPITGEARICDNDNVDINGERSGVGGTPKFIAPEVLQGNQSPNIQSDQHSLAVLLFYMFHLHHPLEGRRCMKIRDDSSPKAQDLLYGSQALFIFDPNNPDNAAVMKDVDPEGLSGHNAVLNWFLYPGYLRDCFSKAFVNGLHDPYSRMTETGWKTILMQLRDGIYECSCGSEVFYDAEKVRAEGGQPQACHNCKQRPPIPPRLGIQRPAERSVVLMTPGKKLFPYHLDSRKDYDISTVVAEVVAHPQRPGALGLKNLTPNNWSATLSNGEAKTVEPNKVVPLSADLRIQFGTSEGRVKL